MNPYRTLTRALILGAAISLPAISHSAEYRMGIFAGSASKDNQTELKAMYKPLVDYIAKATGDTIKPEISQSFANMDRHLGNSRYSIFLAPPTLQPPPLKKASNRLPNGTNHFSACTSSLPTAPIKPLPTSRAPV